MNKSTFNRAPWCSAGVANFRTLNRNKHLYYIVNNLCDTPHKSANQAAEDKEQIPNITSNSWSTESTWTSRSPTIWTTCLPSSLAWSLKREQQKGDIWNVRKQQWKYTSVLQHWEKAIKSTDRGEALLSLIYFQSWRGTSFVTRDITTVFLLVQEYNKAEK